jgi:hypothetical protein
MKHTKEPWQFKDTEMKITGTGDLFFLQVIANVSPKMDYTKGMGTQHANAARIVACVNACAGMDDPAAEIERLRDMEKNIAPILQTVRSLAQQISGDKSIDQMTRLEALGLLMAIPAEKGTNP